MVGTKYNAELAKVLTVITPTLVDRGPRTMVGLTIDVINLQIKIKKVKNVKKVWDLKKKRL